MADIQKIFDIGMKGLGLIQSLAQQSKDITPVIRSLTNVFSKRVEDVTDEELDQIEADLDAALDEFEKPMDKLLPGPKG